MWGSSLWISSGVDFVIGVGWFRKCSDSIPQLASWCGDIRDLCRNLGDYGCMEAHLSGRYNLYLVIGFMTAVCRIQYTGIRNRSVDRTVGHRGCFVVCLFLVCGGGGFLYDGFWLLYMEGVKWTRHFQILGSGNVFGLPPYANSPVSDRLEVLERHIPERLLHDH